MSAVDPNARGALLVPGGTSGPTVPDPTSAPDGQVVTTASGALVLATPSGGPTISTATPAALGTASAGVSTDASASDHAHPHPATTLGTAIAAGTAAGAYVEVVGPAPAAPTLAPGQSMVCLLYPIAAPSGVVIVAQHADAVNEVTRGWHLRAGDNAGSRGELHLFLVGLNSGATIALTGADFTSSTGAPHVLAVAILGDQTVRWSWDGGTVQSRAALSGTYVPPASGDPMRIGVSTLSNAPSTTIQPVAMRWYSTVLSDADLVAVAADRASYRLTDPSAGTLVCSFDARRTRGVQTYPDPVNASIRWRVVGSLERHER